MGISTFRTSVLPAQTPALMLLGALAPFLVIGCDSSSGKHKVSSALFLAPIQAPGGGIQQLTDRLDLLRAIRPGRLDSELQNTPTSPQVLGRLSVVNEAGDVRESDNLLVFESQTKALVSVNLHPDGSSPICGPVRLHYDTRGFGVEEEEGGVIAADVPPIKLKNGWILAYDSSSKNILAFREIDPRETVDDQNNPRTLKYRSATRLEPDCTTDPANANFGRGNGLVFSVVITREETIEQISRTSEPIVTRFFELEENKVLVFFKVAAIRAVHLLELEEVTEPIDFELATPTPLPLETFGIERLKGKYKTFTGGGLQTGAQPFLPFRTVSELTGAETVALDTFQPILIPDPAKPGVDSGVGLVYEQFTSTFLRLSAARDVQGQIKGGELRLAVPSSTFLNAIQGGSGVNLVNPPFTVTFAFYHPDSTQKQILLFEEATNNLFAYDYAAPLGKNMTTFVTSTNVLLRRDPSGQIVEGTRAEPVLSFATDDVRSNRLAFDQGLDQLISFSYTSGVVVVVADVSDIENATGSTLAAFHYIEPLDESRVRAFDTQTSSLIAINLGYAAIPVRIE